MPNRVYVLAFAKFIKKQDWLRPSLGNLARSPGSIGLLRVTPSHLQVAEEWGV